jgi:hypothetical protein
VAPAIKALPPDDFRTGVNIRGFPGIPAQDQGWRGVRIAARRALQTRLRPRYITGRFNSHLADCLLLHADEAFWAGDHAAEGKLKDLVTGHDHFIEYKGKEPVRVQNFVRLLDALESVITIAWTGLITIPGRSIPPHVHSAAESTEVAGQFGGGGTSHAWHCSNKTESAVKDFDLTRPVRPPPGVPAAPPESRRRFSRARGAAARPPLAASFGVRKHGSRICIAMLQCNT